MSSGYTAHRPNGLHQNETVDAQAKRESAGMPAAAKEESSGNLPVTKQEENKDRTPRKGRICGGSFLKELSGSESDNPEEGPLKEVDIDMPLTLTEVTHKDGQEYIVLKFVDGDKENVRTMALFICSSHNNFHFPSTYD